MINNCYGIENKFDFNKNIDKMSKTRNIFYFQKIKKWFNFLDKNSKILDIGAGDGTLLNEFYNAGFKNLYAMDIKNNLDENIKDKVIFKHINLNDLDKNELNINNEYDFIACCNVCEHLFDPLTLISKITNISKNVFFSIPRELNIILRIRQTLFLANLPNPYIVGQHIKFYEPNDIKKIPEILNNGTYIDHLYYRGIGFGRLDEIFKHLSPFLANICPKLFAGDMLFSLKNKSYELDNNN